MKRSALLFAAGLALAGCSSDSANIKNEGAVMEMGAAKSEHDPTQILAVGERAPEFAVRDQDGNLVKLSDYRGKQNVVLIFYPGDDTPGCTKQLCAARDAWADYRERDIQVLGVNPQSAESHKAFVDKYEFPFPILVDEKNEVIGAYGAKGEKYTTRTVYGINKKGEIVFAERGMPETERIIAVF